MPELQRQPDPALLQSISEDIEAGRLDDATTLIAQVEREGYGSEALSVLKDRLGNGIAANAMANSLRDLVAAGPLPTPPPVLNRAQRRSAAKKNRGR